MTDAEILQQCKDEAAKKVKWSSFDHAAENAALWDLNEITSEAMKLYAELAIQKARDEAASQLNQLIVTPHGKVRIEIEPREPDRGGHLSVTWTGFSGIVAGGLWEDKEKLTAVGH